MGSTCSLGTYVESAGESWSDVEFDHGRNVSPNSFILVCIIIYRRPTKRERVP